MSYGESNIPIHVAGELFDRIVITSVGPCRCGPINDGVSFYLHNNDKARQDAGGVLSWADFEKAYLMVKEARRIRAAGLPNGPASGEPK